MDEAFLPLSQMMTDLASFSGEEVDPEAGVRSYIHAFTVESPIELDVFRDEEGRLRLGITPPIYRVNTTFRPTFHNLRFSAVLAEEKAHDA